MKNSLEQMAIHKTDELLRLVANGPLGRGVMSVTEFPGENILSGPLVLKMIDYQSQRLNECVVPLKLKYCFCTYSTATFFKTYQKRKKR